MERCDHDGLSLTQPPPMAKPKTTKPKVSTARSLGDLVKDGFTLKEPRFTLDELADSAAGKPTKPRDPPITRLALASLRLSIEAWLGTVGNVDYQLVAYERIKDFPDYMHSWDYSVAQSEAVVHFQHFAELVCKDLLRSEHELLATVASEDPAWA